MRCVGLFVRALGLLMMWGLLGLLCGRLRGSVGCLSRLLVGLGLNAWIRWRLR